MVPLRLLLVSLCAAAGLVVFAQGPAAACSCAMAGTAEHVENSDVVFLGTLTEIEQTNPGADAVISSGDPVLYGFEVEQALKGDAGDGVVTSARFGATCGLEGMRLGESYVVFAGAGEDGELGANLCGGTSVATRGAVHGVEAALARTGQPPPTVTEAPPPQQPLPTEVRSGSEAAATEQQSPAWRWWVGGTLLALAALVGAVTLRPKSR